MMSTPPNASTAVCTNRSANPSSVTLPTQATAVPPAASIAATVSLAGASSRSLTTTDAPSPASLRAISAPMPRPEPVTMATLPSSFPMCACLSGECDGGVAGQGGGAVREGDGELQGRHPVVDGGDASGARGLCVHRG